MKKLVLLFLVSVSFLFAPPPPISELIIYKDVDQNVKDYCAERDSVFNDWILDVDSTVVNKGYFGLAFLGLAHSEYFVDTLFVQTESSFNKFKTEAEYFSEGLDSTLINIFRNVIHAEDFVHNLAVYFKSGDFQLTKDNIDNFADDTYDFADELDSLFAFYEDSLDTNMEQFATNMDSLFSNENDFVFLLELSGFGNNFDTTYEFSRTAFNRIFTLPEHFISFGNSISAGIDILDSLGEIGSGNTQPAIDSFMVALEELQVALDTLKAVGTNQPFSSLDISVDYIDSVKAIVDSVDLILKGKEYPLDHGEGKTFRPVGIIENAPFGLPDVFLDYYFESTPATYTFGNIFPTGLPSDIIAKINKDMVINIEEYDWVKYTYLPLKDIEYLALLNTGNPNNGDPHAGLAVIKYLQTIDNFSKDASTIFSYCDNANIDSLLFHFGWSKFDYSDECAYINHHLNYIANVDTEDVFVILLKGGKECSPQDNLVKGQDDIVPIYLTQEVCKNIIEGTTKAQEFFTFIADGFDSLDTELNRMFDLYLDPNKIDFEEAIYIETIYDTSYCQYWEYYYNSEAGQWDSTWVEGENYYEWKETKVNDTLLIAALEEANPNFLMLKQYGKDKFTEFGTNLAEWLVGFSAFTDSVEILGEAFAPFASDFDLDSAEVINFTQELASNVETIKEDFNSPGATFSDLETGERIDLSAWFDNPPDNFLQMWKGYVMGTDSTLGGLFPDRYVGVENNIVKPKEFKLYSNYPNPFNPSTTITFDIPEAKKVEIRIYNILGQLVADLGNKKLSAGKHTYVWNATNFSSGVYIARILYNDENNFVKMTLLK